MFDMDLTTEEGTLTYLAARTILEVHSLVRLQGGICNFCWRVNLQAPFRGHNTVVLKHAEPFVASSPADKIPAIRLLYDYRGLKHLHDAPFVNEQSIVTTPSIVHYDPDAQVLIMQDVGLLPTLKTFMSSQPYPSASLASQIGTILGEFIANFHNWGRDNAGLQTLLSTNTTGRLAGKLAFYDRLVHSAAQHGAQDCVLREIAELVGSENYSSEETVLMGDFWPGNMLIDVESGTDGSHGKLKRIWVVDWEFCRYGPSSVDVGMFAAECYWLSRFVDARSGDAILHSFLSTYASRAPINVPRTAIQMGVHWAVWTKYNRWGSEEEMRECILKGVQYCMEGWKGERQWLEQSLVKSLL